VVAAVAVAAVAAAVVAAADSETPAHSLTASYSRAQDKEEEPI